MLRWRRGGLLVAAVDGILSSNGAFGLGHAFVWGYFAFSIVWTPTGCSLFFDAENSSYFGGGGSIPGLTQLRDSSNSCHTPGSVLCLAGQNLELVLL